MGRNASCGTHRREWKHALKSWPGSNRKLSSPKAGWPSDSELSAREFALQTAEQALTARESGLQTAQQQLSRDQADLAQGGELAAQLADARRELAAQQLASEEERRTLQRSQESVVMERDALAEKLAALGNQNETTSAELASQLAAAQQQLASGQSAWDAERSSFEAERSKFEKERLALRASGMSCRRHSPWPANA